MSMHVTTKLARFGSRLEAIGRRHANIESRITALETGMQPNQIALARLKRERRRLVDEMHCYEGLLRTLTRKLGQQSAVA